LVARRITEVTNLWGKFCSEK